MGLTEVCGARYSLPLYHILCPQVCGRDRERGAPHGQADRAGPAAGHRLAVAGRHAHLPHHARPSPRASARLGHPACCRRRLRACRRCRHSGRDRREPWVCRTWWRYTQGGPATARTPAEGAGARGGVGQGRAGSNDAAVPHGVDIALRHNTLLIMWPPTQEEFVHEARTTPTVRGGSEPWGTSSKYVKPNA